MRFLWQMWSEALSNEVVENIISIGEKQPTENATVFSSSSVNTDIRSSTVRWLYDNNIRDILWEYVKQANINAFGVNVENFAEMQFTEYHATENGHYNWHHDVHWSSNNNSDRKISITVQLTDEEEYEGGTFEFNECENPPKESKKKGTILVFPSYLQHRVLPVTKGTRKSLVAWFHGPRWR